MVFNDPHVPWERNAGETVQSEQDPGTDPDGTLVRRNMVPWLALLVFDPEELKLQPGEAVALRIPKYQVPGTNVLDMEAKVPPSGSYPMSIRDYLSLDPSSRINYEAGYIDSKTQKLNAQWADPDHPDDGLSVCPDPTTVIFPTKKLFRDIFANPSDPTTHNIDSFRFMSHVRQVNTVGCPDAGLEAVGLFSIVVSNRTANFNFSPDARPITQVCHLVSIEHIDSTYQNVNLFVKNNPNSTGRIGMISLYSWVYTALPPNPINFVSKMYPRLALD